MKDVIVIGASGHGKVIADIIQKSGDKVYGFLDDNLEFKDTFVNYPILGNTDCYQKYKNMVEFIIAIGNSDARESIALKMKDVIWHTAIHPTAVVSDINVVIDKGTVIMANAVINPGSSIGKHCIINTSSIVEHDNIIEDFVHISVGAKLAGNVHIGKSTWIGIGANVSNNLYICNNCMIGAGATVVSNIDESGVYIGIPARKVKGNS